jgi:hypothetical protein
MLLLNKIQVNFRMNRDLHLRLDTVEELRKHIECLNSIIISTAYHLLKEEPNSALSCLRNARLWKNGENPYGGTSYPADWNSDEDSSESEEEKQQINE